MFPHAAAPPVHAAPQPAGPPGVAAHPPLSAMFQALAARGLAGRGGRPASPGAMQPAGAPIPLMNSGAPPRPAGHMPPMMPN